MCVVSVQNKCSQVDDVAALISLTELTTHSWVPCEGAMVRCEVWEVIILPWLLIILLNLDWAGRAGKVVCLVTTRGGRAGPGPRPSKIVMWWELCKARQCGIEKANQDQLSQPVDQVKELWRTLWESFSTYYSYSTQHHLNYTSISINHITVTVTARPDQNYFCIIFNF